jgi:anaerobic selenocysteine-containing dehydrogenase
MSELNRRGFLKASAGAAAAGVVITTLPAGLAQATGSTSGSKTAAAQLGAGEQFKTPAPAAEPIMAYVRNRATGEIVLYAGTGEIVVRNKTLVRQLDRAAAAAKQD